MADSGTKAAALRARLHAAGVRGWMVAAVTIVIIALAAVALHQRTPPPAGSNQFSPKERAAIEAIVRDYMLNHGDVIPQAMQRLQDREVTKLLDSNRAEIERPFAGAWGGAKDGNVVLVEFFDYNCPFCRASFGDVQKLLRGDPKLKIVYRDLPVLGPASDEAALASLSAATQGRYAAFHDAMITGGRPSHERTIAVIRQARLNELQTARDMTSAAIKGEIKKNLDLARALGVTGTPTYVIGNRILSGAVGYEELKRAIAQARARG